MLKTISPRNMAESLTPVPCPKERDSSFIGFLDGEIIQFRLEPRPGVEEPKSSFPLAEPSPVLGWGLAAS